MANAAEEHFNICLAMGIIMLILPPIKLFIQRRSGIQRHNTSGRLSEVFYILAVTFGCTNAALLCVKSKAESRAMEAFDDPMMVQGAMFQPVWLKVN